MESDPRPTMRPALASWSVCRGAFSTLLGWVLENACTQPSAQRYISRCLCLHEFIEADVGEECRMGIPRIFGERISPTVWPHCTHRLNRSELVVIDICDQADICRDTPWVYMDFLYFLQNHAVLAQLAILARPWPRSMSPRRTGFV